MAASPCEELLRSVVTGQRSGKKWTVIEKLQKEDNATGGNFSVGYIVEGEDKERGFLKATDISLLKRQSSGSILEKATQALNEQSFERAILDICRGNNMDRIVHCIDYGDFEATNAGVIDFVFFIIFEPAQGDVRKQVDIQKRQSFSWVLHAMHNVSVAVQQLHSESVAHNDIKPSNVLIFGDTMQKLGDLGRATADGRAGPWDALTYAGDRTYQAPEYWYPGVQFSALGGRVSFDVRQSSDLYLMGAMAYFMITGQALTPLWRQLLRPEHSPGNWCGTFDDVVPYLRNALGVAMDYFDAELPREKDGRLTDAASEFRAAVMQTVDPDPHLRGHPLSRKQGQPYAVDRYISLFNRLSKHVLVLERMA